MAKYFRDLSIHIGHGQKLPSGLIDRDFNVSTHTVQNIFRYLIQPKFQFHGISKLNIVIVSTPGIIYQKLLSEGIAIYVYPNFNFDSFFLQTPKEQNVRILTVLKRVFENMQIETEIRNTLLRWVQQIHLQNYEHRIVSKLSKWHPKRKVRAVIEKVIDNDGENATLKFFLKNGELISHQHLLKNGIFDFHLKLHKTKWTNNTFQIWCRDGQLFKQFLIEI